MRTGKRGCDGGRCPFSLSVQRGIGQGEDEDVTMRTGLSFGHARELTVDRLRQRERREICRDLALRTVRVAVIKVPLTRAGSRNVVPSRPGDSVDDVPSVAGKVD